MAENPRIIGRDLVESLFPLALGLGKHVMIGGIDAANDASIRFHERLGFERVAHFREVGRKFGRWLDLVFHAALFRSARHNPVVAAAPQDCCGAASLPGPNGQKARPPLQRRNVARSLPLTDFGNCAKLTGGGSTIEGKRSL